MRRQWTKELAQMLAEVLGNHNWHSAGGKLTSQKAHRLLGEYALSKAKKK